jgi:hypothetical protein
VRRSLALLPLSNASSGYLATKISSSLLASLAGAVPLVVPRAFLQTYSAMGVREEHVVLLQVRLRRVRLGGGGAGWAVAAAPTRSLGR